MEIADASLAYDLTRKPAICAAHGVRELWVIDAEALAVHVHRAPGEGGCGAVTAHAATQEVTAAPAPGLAPRGADLDLEE